MLAFSTTNIFDKDLDRMEKRGKALFKIENILTLLIEEQDLPRTLCDHPLKGNWEGYRELHIEPDWLLIYKKTESDLIAARTGTHSDLFFKQRR